LSASSPLGNTLCHHGTVQLLAYLFSILAGMANPIQAGANAELKKTTGTAIFAAGTVYVTGLCGMLIIQLIVREGWPTFEKLGRTPWWAWMGGLLSIGSTMASALFAQRLGSGVFTGISVTASLVTSMLLDNYGIVGFKEHHASPLRILGCALMIGGLWLAAKF
jgi:transporter family-2 protein